MVELVAGDKRVRRRWSRGGCTQRFRTDVGESASTCADTVRARTVSVRARTVSVSICTGTVSGGTRTVSLSVCARTRTACTGTRTGHFHGEHQAADWRCDA